MLPTTLTLRKRIIGATAQTVCSPRLLQDVSKTSEKLLPPKTPWLLRFALFAGIAAGLALKSYAADSPLMQPATLLSSPTATSALGDTTLGKVIMVINYQRGLGKYHSADFRTDGQKVAGLTEEELNKKFDRYLETVSMLNFLIRNGYRVVNFTSARYEYIYLLEKVR